MLRKKRNEKNSLSLRQFFVLIAFFFRFSGPINGDPSNRYLIASRWRLRQHLWMCQLQRNTITVSLTVDDYIEAHRLHFQDGQRASYVIGGLILALGIGLGLSGVNAPVGLIIFGGFGGLVGAWWQDRRHLPRKVAKLYEQLKGIDAPSTISWDEDFLEGESASGSGRRAWKDYVAFKESDTTILLYLNDALWYAFPKRWFSDVEQMESFVRCARIVGKA